MFVVVTKPLILSFFCFVYCVVYLQCKVSILCSFCRILELPPLDSLFELSDPLPLPYHTKQLPLIEFQDFEDFHSGFFSGYELDHVVPINTITDFAHFDTLGSDLSETSVIIQSEYARSSNSEEEKRTSGRKKTALLELDEIQKHFDVPITKAAKEMNVGLTVLKKRCRELKIMRWPHRKIKSLKSLIKNVKVHACVLLFVSR